ncbi:MAG TPA: Stk1 family PASTA domain-containing Ser/Thr kinase [Candidatus Limnocylindria bacterium]|jgi:serine/threonine-protein kinase
MIGRQIGGRYRLIAPLGEGGMATIWRAVDEQLDREVAVKLLRTQFGNDAGFAARFKQEARSAGSLAHHNIVPVYDYGTDGEDGTQYIVMQLVEGDDLSSVLRERTALSTDDAVRVAIGVASALEAAHRRGIVHRDVKPGNILITDEGDVKVTDFGIARAVSEASMTVTGTTLGSVHYFSPEQARGDEVTGASDVYSLGIVLYEMLTGRRPFEGDSAAGVALKRLNEDPQPPETYRPVPSGLSAIVMRALQRDPERRFPDAGSFAEALRVWQRDPAAGAAAAGMAGAGAAGVAAASGSPTPEEAPVPPSGEPTVYVPPPVVRPSDRAPSAVNVNAPPRRPPPPPPPERQGQPWWMWLLALLAIVLLGAIGFLGAQILGGLGPNGTPDPSAETFAMPDWVGDPFTQVRIEADSLGLEIDEEREFSDEVEQGRVISTDPAEGEDVSRGDTVTVVVSRGAEEVEVPRLIGQTRDEARDLLTEVGLRLGRVTEEPSSQPAGTVLRSNPAEGVSVERGEQVDIVLSSGPTPSPEPTPTLQPTPPPTPPPTPTPEPTPTQTATI